MKTRIIVDSTLDLVSPYRERVHVASLTVRFGEEEFEDLVTIDHETFYKRLIDTKVMPSTSQAGPARFEKLYEETTQAGEQGLVITLSEKLSGTYQSAVIAAENYSNIRVIDCGSSSVGGGILVEHAFKRLDEGKSMDEIADELEVLKKRIKIVALVDTLEYLYRGGRLSRTAAVAGALLNIKPVLSVEDGVIHLLGKARGWKQGNNLLDQQIEKAGGIDFGMPVLFGYTGLSDELLLKYIEDGRRLWEGKLDEIRYTTICSVVGTHAGPGALVVAFFAAEES